MLDDNRDKLVAQTYNGAETRGENGGVQTIIQKSYPNAHFVHHYAHRLDAIIERAASQNRRVRIFFSSIYAIPSFFEIPSRQAKLEEFSEKSNVTIKWDTDNVIIAVFENMSAYITDISATFPNV